MFDFEKKANFFTSDLNVSRNSWSVSRYQLSVETPSFC